MICILHFDANNKIDGWIIAHDMGDAQRQCGFDDHELAAELHRMEVNPRPGKYELPSGHLMLVS